MIFFIKRTIENLTLKNLILKKKTNKKDKIKIFEVNNISGSFISSHSILRTLIFNFFFISNLS
jgi:hypothetical protein